MKLSLFFLSGCLLIIACKNEQAPVPASGSVNCETGGITTDYVFTAIQTNCTSRNCHPGGNSPAVADFSTAEKIKTYINTKRSIFELRVTSAEADMPQSQQFPPLSPGMKDSMACWISKGMPDQ